MLSNPRHTVLGDFGQNHGLGSHMQIVSMLPTTHFGLLVDIDSNHPPLVSDSSKTIAMVGMAKQD